MVKKTKLVIDRACQERGARVLWELVRNFAPNYFGIKEFDDLPSSFKKEFRDGTIKIISISRPRYE